MNGTLLRVIICSMGLLFSLTAGVLAQDASASSSQASRTGSPFLIPQTIFVGDSGRLVIPLGRSFEELDPFVWVYPEAFPETPELVIHRIELEKRLGGSRLLVDFIPYVPGVVTLPPLDFLSLPALQVQVASILSPSQTTLSEPASPLAVPGTSFLVYGTLVLVLFLLFLGIGGSLWGRRHFREIWERFRRRHLLRAMKKFLLQLRLDDFQEKKNSPALYLSLLSGELREFLSFFTGSNCRSLTAGEFLELSLGYEDGADAQPDSVPLISAEDERLIKADFLCGLFRDWDTLRFSGRAIDREDLLFALKKTEEFIYALDRVERERPFLAPNRVEINEQEASVESAAEAYISRGSPSEGASL